MHLADAFIQSDLQCIQAIILFLFTAASSFSVMSDTVFSKPRTVSKDSITSGMH